MTVTTPIVSLEVQDNINTTGGITVSGLQFETEQQVVSLSDGTMLVVYRINDGIKFQQVDRLGNAIGAEGQFATPDYLADGDFDILAVEGGDVVLAFEAEGATDPTIVAQSFSINNGVATATNDVAQTFSDATGNFRGVSLAGSSTEDVVLQSLTTATDGTQNLTTFIDLDGTTPPSVDTQVPFNQNRSSLDTAILDNGNIVTTVVSFGVGGTNRQFLDFFITAPDGTLVTSGQTRVPDNATNIAEAIVITLADGGFAMTFAGGDGVAINMFTQAFDANGTPRDTAPIVVFANNNFGNDFNNNPAMVALPDGGYLVALNRQDNRIVFQRFDAEGDKVGDPTLIEEGTVFTPRMTLTEDGLVAITNVQGGDIQLNFLAIEAVDIALSDAAENFTGTGDDDIIDGAGGDDTIDGGAGDDFIIGGAGSDNLDGGAGFDTLSFAGASQGVTVNLSEQTATDGSDTDAIEGFEAVIGSDFDDDIFGSTADNILSGGAGNDVIAAIAGDNTLFGGAGNDTFRVNSVNSNVIDGGDGTDTLDFDFFSGVSSAMEIDLELGTAIGQFDSITTLTSIENVLAGNGNDTISGDDIGNRISGGAGGDLISGRGGDDTLEGGSDADTINGGDGDDVIFAGTEDDPTGSGSGDNLNGDAGNDTITGADDSDTINGGVGNDALDGGGDDDVINGDAGNDLIEGGAGNDILIGDAGGEFSVQLANDDTIYGGDGTDRILGGNGKDSLSGGNGGDTIDGGRGDDFIDGGADGDEILGGEGDDTIDGGSGNDNILGDEGDDEIAAGLGDDLVISGEGADLVFGNEGKDTLEGRAGDDTIEGGTGADSIDGGTGRDMIDGGADNDTLQGGSGRDTIEGGAGDDLIEGGAGRDEIFGGLGTDEIFGDAGDDKLSGEDGADALNGGDGADLLDGGAGADTLDGGSGRDTLIGGDGDDTIDGGTGNDLIIAGLGADEIFGGSGFDTVDYSLSSASIDVTLDTSATVFGFGAGGLAQGDVLISVEGVIGTGFNDRVVGNVKDNTFDGGAGNDVLDGAEGADILRGGDGDDLLIGGTGSDELFGGAGTDTARFDNAFDTFTFALEADGRLSVTAANGDVDLLSDVESLEFTDGTFTAGEVLGLNPTDGADLLNGTEGTDEISGLGGNDTINGNGGADTLNGDNGSDIINGNRGNDLIDGGRGNDTLNGNRGDDTILGGDGSDTLDGGENDDSLEGGNGADRVIGGAGDDVVGGGNGRDVLIGGSGADTFVFTSTGHSGTGNLRDVITDFEDGTDLIDFSEITGTLGFIGADAFSATGGGELRLVETGSGNTVVVIDADGDGGTDMQVLVLGVTGLASDDFLL